MIEFLLFSRTGRTDGNFRSLMEAGRLDIVYQCVLTSLFRSHGHRNDVVFHAVLHGPPSPPLHLQISANELRDARIDERSWEEILRKVLNGNPHPGIIVQKGSMQKIIRDRAEAGYRIFVLAEGDENISGLERVDNMLFVVGDNSGLPVKEEGFVLRYGSKLSLGNSSYLAASCIDIINYTLD